MAGQARRALLSAQTLKAEDHNLRNNRSRTLLRRHGRGQASHSDRRRRPGLDAGRDGASIIVDRMGPDRYGNGTVSASYSYSQSYRFFTSSGVNSRST